MDFDHEAQLFRISPEEAHILNLHPAWMECKRADALKLFALLSSRLRIQLDTPGSIHHRRQDARRQTVALRLGQSLIEQLEPYVQADIALLSSQLPTISPESLE